MKLYWFSLKREYTLTKLIESMYDLRFSVFLSPTASTNTLLFKKWLYLEKYQIFRKEILTMKIVFYNY